MKNVEVQLKGDLLIIGKDPRLVVNLKSQENYIETGSRKIPYRNKNTVQQGPAGRKAAECFSDCCKLLLSAGMPGGRRDENSAAVQAESEQDSPGEGEGRAFIDNSRVYQIYSNQGSELFVTVDSLKNYCLFS